MLYVLGEKLLTIKIDTAIPQLFFYPQREGDTETAYITKFIKKRQETGAVAFSFTWNPTPAKSLPSPDVWSDRNPKATAKLVLTQFLTKIGFDDREENMLNYFFDVSDMHDDCESEFLEEEKNSSC